MANGHYSTIAGGYNNTADAYSFVGGGGDNNASGVGSSISGGYGNTVTDNGYGSFVGAGSGNTASGQNSFIGAGQYNTASGWYSMVPGGFMTEAGGNYSFAAGYKAHVRSTALGDPATDNGTFAWADSTYADFISDGANRFLVRASGGTKIYSNSTATVGVQLFAGGNSWSPISDRNVKENVTPIDAREVLDRLAAIPIAEWNLISQDPAIRHIGPMAQDFYAAFGVGEVETHISSSDADGVALAAIQGLHELVSERDCRIEELAQQNDQLAEQNQQLEARLSALEAKVGRLLGAKEGGTR
ncbi:MAG: tail fiber domain-containing protein [Planctomycetota bacterium]